jgi:hypothetical protein
MLGQGMASPEDNADLDKIRFFVRVDALHVELLLVTRRELWPP